MAKTYIPGRKPIEIFGPSFAQVPGLPPLNVFTQGIKWILRDEFTTAASAGSIPTAAEPGPGVRAITDSGNKVSISSGKAVFNGTVGWTDPFWHYGTIAKTAGRILIVTCTPTQTNKTFWYGLSAAANGGNAIGPLYTITGTIQFAEPSITTVVSNYSANYTYKTAIISRNVGGMLFIKEINTYPNFTLLYTHVTYNEANSYVGIIHAGTADILVREDFIRIPQTLWLPTPLLSDGFGSTFGTSDGLGHAEGIAGGLGSGGGDLDWFTAGTWATGSGVVANTPVEGTVNLTDGNMEAVGTASWTAYGSSVLAKVADERTGGAGSQSMSITNGAAAYGSAYQQLTFPIGSWLKLSGWGKMITAGNTLDLIMYSNAFVSQIATAVFNSTSWQYQFCIGRVVGATNARVFIGNKTNTLGNEGRFDDLSLYQMPISTLITNQSLTTTDVLAEQVISAYTLGSQVGIVQSDRPFAFKANANAASGQNVIVLKGLTSAVPDTDSITIKHPITPTTYTIASVSALAGGVQTLTLDANLVEAVSADDWVGVDWASWNGSMHYFDGAGNIKVDEILAGVYTNRGSTGGAPATFSAGTRFIVRKIGSEYRIFYKEALVGTAISTIVAGAMTGTYWGMFSTLAENTISSFCVYDTGAVTNIYSSLDKYSFD